MSNILTTLIGDQLRRYGADRVAYSTIDYDGRRLVRVCRDRRKGGMRS